MKNLIDLPIMTQALDTARQEYARDNPASAAAFAPPPVHTSPAARLESGHISHISMDGAAATIVREATEPPKQRIDNVLPPLQLFAPVALWLAYRHLGTAAFAWIGRIASLFACLTILVRGLLDHNFYLPRGRMPPK